MVISATFMSVFVLALMYADILISEVSRASGETNICCDGEIISKGSGVDLLILQHQLVLGVQTVDYPFG